MAISKQRCRFIQLYYPKTDAELAKTLMSIELLHMGRRMSSRFDKVTRFAPSISIL
jgi:hypothetical protein